MPKMLVITLLYSLIIITGGAFAYAQNPPQSTQQVPQTSEVAPPKQISTVIVENNRLSVEFINVSFGEILKSIGKKAGFRVEGTSKVLNIKVTTKFNDLDIDSGIVRLFSLVKESNYLISYNTKGSISKLKIYQTVGDTRAVGSAGTVGSNGAVESVPPVSSPAEETGAVPFRAWRSRRRPPTAVIPSPAPVPEVFQPATTDQGNSSAED